MSKILDYVRDLEGVAIDLDDFPSNQKYQCHDILLAIKEKFNLKDFNTYCGLTGNTIDVWNNRKNNKSSKYFTYIYDFKDIKDGDIIFCKTPIGHVCIYDHGYLIGQNQPYPYVTRSKFNFSFLGAFRLKEGSDEMKKIRIKAKEVVRFRDKPNGKILGEMKKGETGTVNEIKIVDGKPWVRWNTGTWSAIAGECWFSEI